MLATRQRVAQSVGELSDEFHKLASRMRLSDKWSAGFESRELSHAAAKPAISGAQIRAARAFLAGRAGSRAVCGVSEISHRGARKNSTSCPGMRGRTLLQSAPRLNARHRVYRQYRRARRLRWQNPASDRPVMPRPQLGGGSLNSRLAVRRPIGLLDCDGWHGPSWPPIVLLELRLPKPVAQPWRLAIVAVDAGHADAADAVIVEQQRIAASTPNSSATSGNSGRSRTRLPEGAARPAAQRAGRARFAVDMSTVFTPLTSGRSR